MSLSILLNEVLLHPKLVANASMEKKETLSQKQVSALVVWDKNNIR